MKILLEPLFRNRGSTTDRFVVGQLNMASQLRRTVKMCYNFFIGLFWLYEALRYISPIDEHIYDLQLPNVKMFI